MRGKSIASEISISELREMRDSGMSNAMIGKRLEISPSTVARYLGPMTHEERSRIMRERDFLEPETAPVTPIRTEPVKPLLPLAAVNFELEGLFSNYKINTAAKRIDLQLNEIWVSVGMDDLSLLIEELRMVQNSIDNMMKTILINVPFKQ